MSGTAISLVHSPGKLVKNDSSSATHKAAPSHAPARNKGRASGRTGRASAESRAISRSIVASGIAAFGEAAPQRLDRPVRLTFSATLLRPVSADAWSSDRSCRPAIPRPGAGRAAAWRPRPQEAGRPRRPLRSARPRHRRRPGWHRRPAPRWRPGSAGAAQRDGAALGNGAQPRQERPLRIIGRHGAMDGQQHVLNHVFHPVGRHAMPPCGGGGERHAGAQQRLIGERIAPLRGGHQRRERNVSRFGQNSTPARPWHDCAIAPRVFIAGRPGVARKTRPPPALGAALPDGRNNQDPLNQL